MSEDGAPARGAPGMRKWIAAFVVCFALSVGIPIGYSTWLVTTYARHACQALDLINGNVPPHLTPTQVQFYAATKVWADGDGC